jgi:hypothetical protein
MGGGDRVLHGGAFREGITLDLRFQFLKARPGMRPSSRRHHLAFVAVKPSTAAPDVQPAAMKAAVVMHAGHIRSLLFIILFPNLAKNASKRE